mgnify:FL=1
MSILEYQDLSLNYDVHPILQDINLKIEKGNITVIVGQSGSGKSTLLKATLGLLPSNAKIVKGHILFEDTLLKDEDLDRLRGTKIGMIYQNPLTFFDDFKTIAYHFYEALYYHFHLDEKQAKNKAKTLLNQVLLDESILEKYPFELSGGMAQRVMIALTLSLQPDLILADEPTSSLDVVSQKQLLDLLLDLKKQTTIVLVTHNIQVAKYLADQIVVIKDGRIIEQGKASQILTSPTHPYTKSLIMKG